MARRAPAVRSNWLRAIFLTHRKRTYQAIDTAMAAADWKCARHKDAARDLAGAR
jgi:hypothetical protein